MRVCFLQFGLASLLSNGIGGRGEYGKRYLGGAERQTYQVASGLRQRGHFTTAVVYYNGQRRMERYNGLYMLSGPLAPGYKAPFLTRTVNPLRLARALEASDCDIYVQRVADIYTGLYSAYVRGMKAKFVFSVGHDSDLFMAPGPTSRLVRAMSLRYGLKGALAVIVQTREQADKAKELAPGARVEIIPPVCPVPGPKKKQGPVTLAWIGYGRPWKKPDIFLDLVEKLLKAGLEFGVEMVVHPHLDQEFHKRTKRRFLDLASQYPRQELKWHDGLPHSRVEKILERDVILVNTSEAEGFPSTFLEAWSRSCPVVSLNVDPDGIIEDKRLGACTRGNFTTALGSIKGLMAESKKRRDTGSRARDHVANHHDPNTILDKYEEVLGSLI